MTYGTTKTVSLSLEEADAKIRTELQKQGFGILTEINVHNAFKDKLGIDFPPYRILGACHPQLAHRAMSLEADVGLLMPCNVVLSENPDQTISVSIAKASSILSITNTDLSDLAQEVDALLSQALESL